MEVDDISDRFGTMSIDDIDAKINDITVSLNKILLNREQGRDICDGLDDLVDQFGGLEVCPNENELLKLIDEALFELMSKREKMQATIDAFRNNDDDFNHLSRYERESYMDLLEDHQDKQDGKRKLKMHIDKQTIKKKKHPIKRKNFIKTKRQ